MTIAKDIIAIVQECTDELLAVTVVGGTMTSFFVGIEVPSEPMIMVLGFYFLKKAVQQARD